MADTTLSGLTETTTLASTDLLYVLDGANSRKATLETLAGFLAADGILLSDMTDTWDDSGTNYSGIKLSVTDTASGASSRLLDLVYNAASMFWVDKSGNTNIANNKALAFAGTGRISAENGNFTILATGESASGASSSIRAGNSVDFQFRTSNTVRWKIGRTTGHWLADADNTYDIGASGATRPRTGYYGTSVVSPLFNLGSGTTVSGLPGSPTVGMVARVTDADTPSIGSTVVGSGSSAALVWYNGTNWTVIGV